MSHDMSIMITPSFFAKNLGATVVSTVQQRCHATTLRHPHLALLGGAALLHGDVPWQMFVSSCAATSHEKQAGVGATFR